MKLREIDGWWCPAPLSGPGKYRRHAEEDAPLAINLCRQKRVALQAGGHIGTWPCFLSRHFGLIYTWEATQENFYCLARNVAEHADPAKVFMTCGALGNKPGPIDMVMSGKSTGQHRVRHPASRSIGSVPTYRIDDLALPHVDAIFLDVEGYEQHALMGARETLKRCGPVVMAESNKRAQDHGFRPDDLEIFMRSQGYEVRERVSEDVIFCPNGRS